MDPHSPESNLKDENPFMRSKANSEHKTGARRPLYYRKTAIYNLPDEHNFNQNCTKDASLKKRNDDL